MGLFGDFTVNEPIKKQPTLIEMAVNKFSDDKQLLEELKLYLRSRKEQKNMPTKVSWEMQLTLLEMVPMQKRASQVHTATLRGWRQIAYEDNKADGVTRTNKTPQLNIVNQGF